MNGEIATRGFLITERSVNEADGTHVFVISDESVDSHRTVFMSSGWKMQRYESNPIVTIGHPDPNTTDTSVIIGRSEIFFEGTKMKARIHYDMGNPKAVEVKRQVEGGFLNEASIRAIVRGIDKERSKSTGVPHFNDNEFIDWGIVMHASNRGAKAESRSFDEIMTAFGVSDDTPPPAENVPNPHLDEARSLIEKFKQIVKK